MKKVSLLLDVILLIGLSACSKNNPYPEYETTFSFEERIKSVIIDENTRHVYLKGMVARLYSGMHDQKLRIIPGLTTATKEQYDISDSLILSFRQDYDRDSIKIDIFPEQIKKPIVIAFTVENLVVGKDYSLYMDTTIINLIPAFFHLESPGVFNYGTGELTKLDFVVRVNHKSSSFNWSGYQLNYEETIGSSPDSFVFANESPNKLYY